MWMRGGGLRSFGSGSGLFDGVYYGREGYGTLYMDKRLGLVKGVGTSLVLTERKEEDGRYWQQ